MAFNNNAKIIRRELLKRLSKIQLDDKVHTEIDRIPLKMRPKKGGHVRCCTYRDRAVIKYRIMAMLGFEGDKEEDELYPLSAYFDDAMGHPNTQSPILTVVDEACSSCIKNNYVVTNMCQGCVGRACMVNCPKGAVDFHGNQAKINPEKCVNCGLCQKACQFHAIIYAPVPCEDVCPVGAIQKDEYGIEKINMDDCILCGKCLEACPFGAIVEKSHLFDVIREIKTDHQVIAMVAPSIAGQFRDSMGKILGGVKALGFDKVVEVATGADITAKNEAGEFRAKIEEGRSMTTSCCPSYVNLIKKHSPDMSGFVSTTLTPMEYTAIELRKTNPDARLVFIGPCVAKKGEAMESGNVDYVINYEEFGTWLIAAGIEISECGPYSLEDGVSAEARFFAKAGGVGAAVAAHLPDVTFETIQIDGIDKTFLRKLKAELKNPAPRLVEVMSCENGCVGGCSSINNSKVAINLLNKFVESEKKKCHSEKQPAL